MPRPVKLQVDCTTGEERYVDLTDEEIAQLEVDAATYDADKAAKEAAAEEAAAVKAAAIAKLAALGLTEEEAAAIAGL